MAKKVFAGHALRKLRERAGLTQVEFARRLTLSPSYVNQIESNQRPLSAAVLLAVGRTFQVDIASFDADDLDRVVADLREALADPMFRGDEPSLQELKNATTQAPGFAHAFLRLHGSMRRLVEQQASLDETLAAAGGGAHGDARALMPYEEVRDYFHYIDNYVDDLDRAAEASAEALAMLGRDDRVGVLAAHLERRHGIRVEIEPTTDPSDPLLRFDPARRRVTLSAALDQATRAFRLATLVGRFEQAGLIDAHIAAARFRNPAAMEVCRLAFQNYFAGALLLPYRRFLHLAQAQRHDLDRLMLMTGASLEQVGHRLATMQRPGEKGIPFYFLKIDRAGNVIKRHSATRFQFARYGGACPVWNIHEAFEQTPSRTLVQLGEMPDGVRYLCLARSIVKEPMRHGLRERRYALGLGCEAAFAADLVYADGLDLRGGATPAPLGINCRICPRGDCIERAFPAIDRDIRLDPDVRGIVPFTLAN